MLIYFPSCRKKIDDDPIPVQDDTYYLKIIIDEEYSNIVDRKGNYVNSAEESSSKNDSGIFIYLQSTEFNNFTDLKKNSIRIGFVNLCYVLPGTLQEQL